MSSPSLSHEDVHAAATAGITQRIAQWFAEIRAGRHGHAEPRRSEVERELHSLFGSANAGPGDDA